MSPSDQISQHIEALPSWQADLLRTFRALIHAADAEVVEAWKWSTPVYMHDGLVCATGVFKDHVKINFQGSCISRSDLFQRWIGIEAIQGNRLHAK